MDAASISLLYSTYTGDNTSRAEIVNVSRTMKGYYEIAKPFLQAKDRMLDVGCDIGLFLKVAQEDGFKEMNGLELVPAARQYAAEIPNSVIGASDFEQAKYPQAHFDLISFIHVVDHLFDPRRSLAKAFGLLKPGGVILAVVHNARSVLARLLGEKWPIYNLYHHYFFDKGTLGKLLAADEFEVLRLESTVNCYSTGFLASRLPGASKRIQNHALDILTKLGADSISVRLPLGNIAIVARRPLESASP